MPKPKTAIITGGSKGIGFTIAKVLAKKKYNIVICSRNLKDLKKAKQKIDAYGVKCLTFKTDVSKYSECKSLVQKSIKAFSKIDLLVNNAGVQGPIDNAWESDIKYWENTIRINFFGAFYMINLVVPYMIKQKNGVVINLSGGGAAYGRAKFSAYACSKTAILRLTEILSDEVKGKNIKVFALAPGTVWTNMAKEALQSKKKLDKKSILQLKAAQKTGGTETGKLEKLLLHLLNNKSNNLSGRLIHVNELEELERKSLKFKPESGLLRRVDYR